MWTYWNIVTLHKNTPPRHPLYWIRQFIRLLLSMSRMWTWMDMHCLILWILHACSLQLGLWFYLSVSSMWVYDKHRMIQKPEQEIPPNTIYHNFFFFAKSKSYHNSLVKNKFQSKAFHSPVKSFRIFFPIRHTADLWPIDYYSQKVGQKKGSIVSLKCPNGIDIQPQEFWGCIV